MDDTKELQKAYAAFVEDLGGFLNTYQKTTRQSWEQVGRECYLCAATVYNLAHFKTKNPQLYTAYKILRFIRGDSRILRRVLRERM